MCYNRDYIRALPSIFLEYTPKIVWYNLFLPRVTSISILYLMLLQTRTFLSLLAILTPQYEDGFYFCLTNTQQKKPTFSIRTPPTLFSSTESTDYSCSVKSAIVEVTIRGRDIVNQNYRLRPFAIVVVQDRMDQGWVPQYVRPQSPVGSCRLCYLYINPIKVRLLYQVRVAG